MPSSTFEVKLGCDNCGRDSVHDLPKRAEITVYDWEDSTPSSYQVGNKDSELLLCRNCGLPQMRVLVWDEEPKVKEATR